jgi:long-subunit acyl-CoA synthetase (AMP-forming)
MELLTSLCNFGFNFRYDTIGPDNLSQVIKDSMITTLFCSSEILAVASKSKNLGGLKKIICFDDVDSETLSKIMQKGIKCYTFKSLVELGKSRAYLHRPPIIVPTDCMTMICPSGTTGQVVGSTKLLMLSHLNFLACCSIIPTNKDLDIS